MPELSRISLIPVILGIDIPTLHYGPPLEARTLALAMIDVIVAYPPSLAFRTGFACKRNLTSGLHSSPYSTSGPLERSSVTLVDRFQRFVSPQKACDKGAGEDLLRQLEALPVKETREFGFSLVESAMILQVMVDHQRRLKEIDESLKTLVK